MKLNIYNMGLSKLSMKHLLPVPVKVLYFVILSFILYFRHKAHRTQ